MMDFTQDERNMMMLTALAQGQGCGGKVLAT